MTHELQPGDWITGPFWPGSVQIISLQARAGYDLLTVAHAGASHTCILTPADKTLLFRVTQADRRASPFDGDPDRFRLGIQAQRLRLAHAIDPYAGLNASRIDPLPHQFEAVYEQLLARPVVRALLAHDAGAGKTIMAGLLLKELQRRQGIRRILIVAPAGLTIQWRRELLTKFGLDFTLVDRDAIRQQRSDDLLIWRDTDYAITSVDFARQKGLRQALTSVEWDLVIVDEAHKLAAYRRPNGSVQKTQAYELGEVLARHTTHFLLMTATPHKGDPENYRLLLALLDPRQSEALAHASGPNPLVLRRTKEEMRKPDGAPLYPARIVAPQEYRISPAEGELLEAVQKFAARHYGKAQAANVPSAGFALLTLSRRMASSPYALWQSLERLRAQIAEGAPRRRLADDAGAGDADWAAWEDLSESERWQREAQAEAAVGALFNKRTAQAELRILETLSVKAQALAENEQQAKLQALREACALWVGERGEQLILFTEFKDTLDYLVERLAAWGYTTTQIHGGLPLKARRRAEQDFWDGKAQVLVATEAAGEGINLQCCRVLLNYDIPWNPCRLEQRMGRIHRYGQLASEVHIFNLIATNTMEDEVKAAILAKQEAMRADLGDRVFNVLGEAVWNADLRRTLERIALGDRAAVADAQALIARAAEAATVALAAEQQQAAALAPLDVAAFRRKQATFAAHRLSPEEAEKFFRVAVPLVGGVLTPFEVSDKNGRAYPAYEVTLPPGVLPGQRRRWRLSFWPAACSDDDTEEDAVLFIAPGHALFEMLLDRVLAECTPDLARGAVFLDLQPASSAPYLVWLIRAGLRDGRGNSAGGVLAALQHRADAEQVTPLPTEILDAFEGGVEADPTAIAQGRLMLAAQETVVDACVQTQFLPALAAERERLAEATARDRAFLLGGLTALAEDLTLQGFEALGAGDVETGEQLLEQATAAQDRQREVLAELERAGQLLLTAPEVLGAALVLPAPLEIAVAGDAERIVMHRDDAVEAAAMDAALRYERKQNRRPQDVHIGHSWDIESYDAAGNLLRIIEVKGRGPEDAAVVTLTEPEWEAARRHGDQHWLYIVRLGDGLLWTIQNPYAKLQPKELKRWVVKIQDAAAQATDVAHIQNE